jgi:hypothetical protein
LLINNHIKIKNRVKLNKILLLLLLILQGKEIFMDIGGGARIYTLV